MILNMVIPLFLFTALTAADKPIAMVSYLLGEAHLQKQNQWEKISLNTKILSGDKVRTSESSAIEIKYLNSPLVVRLGEKSEAVISPLQGQDTKNQLLAGKIWVNLKKIGQSPDQFSVASPLAVAAIRGTIFRMNFDSSQTTAVLCYDGKVDVGPEQRLKDKIEQNKKPSAWGFNTEGGPGEVSGPREVSLEEWVQIVKGMQINVKSNGEFQTFQFDQKKDAQEEWVSFNEQRDAIQPVEK